MLTVLEVTLPVFALVFCGFAGARFKLLPDRPVDGLNAFVYWFALPALLLRVVASHPISQLLDGGFIAGYLAATLLLFGLAWRVSRAGGYDRSRRDGLQATADALTSAHGNIGYLGLALVAEVGRQYLPTVALAIICDVFVLITVAVVLFEVRRSRHVRGWRVGMTIVRGLSRSPLFLAIGAGLILSLMQWRLPAVADNFIRLLSNAAGPCALFAIGAALGGQKLIIDRPTMMLVAAKLVAHPLLVALFLLVLLPVDRPKAAIGILCATLPSGSNTFILGQRYGADTRAISGAILLGTFVALATVSLAIWCLGLER